jgi:hypothetical protein
MSKTLLVIALSLLAASFFLSGKFNKTTVTDEVVEAYYDWL